MSRTFQRLLFLCFNISVPFRNTKQNFAYFSTKARSYPQSPRFLNIINFNIYTKLYFNILLVFYRRQEGFIIRLRGDGFFCRFHFTNARKFIKYPVLTLICLQTRIPLTLFHPYPLSFAPPRFISNLPGSITHRVMNSSQEQNSG